MKSKNGARFEPATHRLQATEQLDKLSNFVQIKNKNKTSFSLFISKGSMSNNGGVPFPLIHDIQGFNSMRENCPLCIPVDLSLQYLHIINFYFNLC